MSFYVDLHGLYGLVQMLGRLEIDADSGKNYVATHTQLQYGEGLINKLRGGHTHVVADVTKFLATLSGPVAERTAWAVASTIGSYHRGDLDSAAEMEAAYGETTVSLERPTIGYLERYAGYGPFLDPHDAGEAYKPPADYSSAFPHEFAPSDLASPASIGRDVIWGATGYLAHLGMIDRAYDPYETWIKPLAGDWAGMRACVDVFDNVAAASERMGDNVYHAALGLPVVWRGNAADACLAHLVSVKGPLYGATDALHAIAIEYRDAAEGAADIGKALGSLLSDLIDAALIFMCEVAAAGSTSMTVVGAIIFGGAAVYEAKLVVDIIREMLDLYSRVSALMDSVAAAANDFGVIDSGPALPRLPSAPPHRPEFP